MVPWRSLGLLLLACSVAATAGPRAFEPIESPGSEGPETRMLPDGEREAVERWLRDLVADWNTPGLARYLDPEFPDRTRLLAAIEEQVPPGARLRLLSHGVPRVEASRELETGREWILRVRLHVQVEVVTDEGVLERRPAEQEVLVRWVRRAP